MQGLPLWLSFVGGGRAHLVQVVQVQGFQCPAVCVPCLLSALLLRSRCVACKYGSISRFKGVSSVVWGFCVGLLGLGALRGLCGFCVRVELGG